MSGLKMTQDELWFNKYQEIVAFIEKNKRNPSKYNDEERGRYLNWLKHRIRGTGTFIHSLYTNKHNLFPQESLSKCSLN